MIDDINTTQGIMSLAPIVVTALIAHLKIKQKKKAIEDFCDSMEDAIADKLLTADEVKKLIRKARRV